MPSVLRGGSWSTAVLAAGQGTSSNLEPRVYRIKYVVVQVYGFNRVSGIETTKGGRGGRTHFATRDPCAEHGDLLSLVLYTLVLYSLSYGG